MNLIRYSPARDLWNIRDDMDKLFNRFLGRSFEGDEVADNEWVPHVDIAEGDNSFTLKAELPGMNKDDIKISLHDNVLTLRGEKSEQKEVKENTYHLCERRYGKFIRSFRLSTPVDSRKIEASFKDGVLNIMLPKHEEAKPKEIPIQVN